VSIDSRQSSPLDRFAFIGVGRVPAGMFVARFVLPDKIDTGFLE
jgi:hypothetical protein